MSDTKPPIGLMPRWRHDEMRQEAILDAISRYKAEGKPIPQEWVDELVELLVLRAARRSVDEVSE